MKRPLALVICALAFAAVLPSARAAGPVDDIETAASATAQAQPVFAATDVISIYNRTNALSPEVAAAAVSAVGAARGVYAFGRGASIGMDRVLRNGVPIQEAPPGFHYPMSTTVLPLDAVGHLMGRNVAGVLASGFVVMGATTAAMRGAQVGDTIQLVGANGGLYTLGIGMVADDAVIGGTEILMSPPIADALGVTVTTRIVLWGFSSRDAIDAQLNAAGLLSRADTRVRQSWDPFDPDFTLGMTETKQKLGEFAYAVNSNGVDVSVTGDWSSTYIPPNREVLYPPIPINARCNNVIKADLRAALAEVDAAGLAGAIDVGNANTYGGCYYPRFSRTSGAVGYLSRHSWGQALDTNTTSNAQGTAPRMNCDVVRIFRKHNFAWGGNFLTPDGMHFEWVGERRDQYQYPSRYCPNLPAPAGAERLPSVVRVGDGVVPQGRATLFVDDAWSGE